MLATAAKACARGRAAQAGSTHHAMRAHMRDQRARLPQTVSRLVSARQLARCGVDRAAHARPRPSAAFGERLGIPMWGSMVRVLRFTGRCEAHDKHVRPASWARWVVVHARIHTSGRGQAACCMSQLRYSRADRRKVLARPPTRALTALAWPGESNADAHVHAHMQALSSHRGMHTSAAAACPLSPHPPSEPLRSQPVPK